MGAAQAEDAHESFLNFEQLALALVFFFGAVGEGLFQEDQVAPELELAKDESA